MSADQLPMPEPAGFRMRFRSEPDMIGHYPWTYADSERRRRKYDRPECDYEDLYTADQLRAYGDQRANAALEQAYDAMFSLKGDKVTRFDAQTAIRALKKDPSHDH